MTNNSIEDKRSSKVNRIRFTNCKNISRIPKKWMLWAKTHSSKNFIMPSKQSDRIRGISISIAKL